MNALKLLSVVSPLVFLVLFVLFAVTYEEREQRLLGERLSAYEKILGNCLYDLDEQGAQLHINAAFLSEPEIRSIRVRHASGELFVSRESPYPLDGLLQAFSQLDLISSQSVEQEVKVKGEFIGGVAISYVNGSVYGLLWGAALASAFALAAHQLFLRLELSKRKEDAFGAPLPHTLVDGQASTLIEEIQKTSALLKRANSILRDTELSPEQKECARRLRRGAERLNALALCAAEQASAVQAPPQESAGASSPDSPPPPASPAPEDPLPLPRPSVWRLENVQERLGVDWEELPQYLRISLDEMDRRVELCRSALENGKMSEAALHAHTLKSTSNSLSLERCRALAQQMEKAATSGEREEAGRLLGRYENALRIDCIPIRHCLEHESGREPAGSVG